MKKSANGGKTKIPHKGVLPCAPDSYHGTESITFWKSKETLKNCSDATTTCNNGKLEGPSL
jgi:hypothetical protein